VFWYILAGLPLLFAAILAARLLGFTGSRLGLQMASWPPQLLISLSAIPLSFVAYQLHDAILPQPNDGAASALTGVLLVLIVLGMLEEVIFRGLLLQATKTVFGSWAIPYSALLYAIVHVGWQSVEVMAFAAVAGLFWGWCAMRTGSIWGVMFAHGLLNAYVLIWPLVWP
jgi:membrane protease YdiL (CAAX protease family)